MWELYELGGLHQGTDSAWILRTDWAVAFGWWAIAMTIILYIYIFLYLYFYIYIYINIIVISSWTHKFNFSVLPPIGQIRIKSEKYFHHEWLLQQIVTEGFL